VALHNKKAISMYGDPNKDTIKILLKVVGYCALSNAVFMRHPSSSSRIFMGERPNSFPWGESLGM
jgi:hypothetical protein